MSKPIKPRKITSKKTRAEWPLVVYVWSAGLGLTGYLIARIGLDALPHPVHWASGLVGALIGGFVGWLWYGWRGDII